MFFILRTVIALIIGCSLWLIFRKIRIKNKFLTIALPVAAALIIMYTPSFLAVNNGASTFYSAEDAFNYLNSGTTKDTVVLQGEEYAFVVNYKNGTLKYMLCPKTDGGYIIRYNTFDDVIFRKANDDKIIEVFHAENSKDYFLVIYVNFCNDVPLTDKNGSEFITVYNNGAISIGSFNCVRIENMTEDYWIDFEDERIYPFRD